MRPIEPLIFLSVILAAGCTVGPDFKEPQAEVPQAYQVDASARTVSLSSESADLDGWWKHFHDNQLSSLVERSLKANLDLKIAITRLEEARLRRAVIAGGLYPSVFANGAYSRVRISENGLPFGPPQAPVQSPAQQLRSADIGGNNTASTGAFGLLPEFNLYQIGFDSSWELDLFGRVRRQVEAADAETSAAAWAGQSIMVAMSGEVARDYLQLRGAEEQLRIAMNDLGVARETVELIVSKVKTGTATDLDLTRAQAELHDREARIPPLRRLHEDLKHQLAFLVALQPGALDDEFRESRPIPVPEQEIAIGVPGELLRRRPDVRQAESVLAAAVARVGVAKADMYPRFALTGAFSFASARPGNLFDWSSRGFSAGPGVSVPLFEGGALRALVALRNAEVNEALAQYQRAVLQSLHEVQAAIDGLLTEQDRVTALEKARRARKDSVSLSRSLYERGLTDLTTVLDSQRLLFTTEEQLATSQQQVSLYAVALYKALGGGYGDLQAAPENSEPKT